MNNEIKKSGLICIGYQGIGKSTLAANNLKWIDLESSCFWVDGKRDVKWYVAYGQMAEHLCRQGYNVFVSSHEVVRNYLKNSTEKVICCVPALELKDQWIERLKKRYDESGLEKDYKAYMNAVDRYEENIKEIKESGFDIVELNVMEYELDKVIEEAIAPKTKLIDADTIIIMGEYVNINGEIYVKRSDIDNSLRSPNVASFTIKHKDLLKLVEEDIAIFNGYKGENENE